MLGVVVDDLGNSNQESGLQVTRVTGHRCLALLALWLRSAFPAGTDDSLGVFPPRILHIASQRWTECVVHSTSIWLQFFVARTILRNTQGLKDLHVFSVVIPNYTNRKMLLLLLPLALSPYQVLMY